ncbi:MAG: galactose-1-epimerase [Candidatus Pseudobacter hemicellulosilyticus]|uniref:Galactose-1-epimerase n=1 Tax=Candidatus Pseudobacter hemicellulosilyticus TaxID=3121375 RepID=A0AAJ6BHP5_9BACT|nr:MAG: galactose-1-epimerase [Pseudobacter sp.]
MLRNVLMTLLLLYGTAQAQSTAAKWTEAKANAWYAQQGWLRGANYQPATAINQLEMFQAATFDSATIDKELGWAEGIGFNVMRVYLHHLLWVADKEGFKKRLDQYLAISSRHGIKTLLVFFDDCWNDTAWVGTQPAPKPGVHNSGWVRDPGTMIYTHQDTLKTLEAYVKDVLTTFKNDQRILMWDLYNEPGNNRQEIKSLPLLKKVFQWAREVNPSQPLTAGVWNHSRGYWELNAFQLENSDVITYHNYSIVDNHKNNIDTLRKWERPIICTEYMARRNASVFQTILPLLKEENVGAINWGFVAGKTNTIFAWDTPMPNRQEPDLWFHDIFRTDGTPFSADEVRSIKELTGKNITHYKLPAKANFDQTVQGKQVSLYYLSNKNNYRAAISNFGARMVGMLVPDKTGQLTDVVIGFNDLNAYLKGDRFAGAIVGRFGNRIAKGTFKLDGKTYKLDINNGVNTLHGGRTGFHSRVWDAVQPDSHSVVLTYVSANKEEGYPGKLTATVTYTLTDDNELRIDYAVTADQKTVANLTNHNYWNMNGEGSGTINNHALLVKASKYTPVDATLIPTGIEPVSGTPFDFTTAKKIGSRLKADDAQLRYGAGYDHNFVADKGITAQPELIATITGDVSGIKMDILTTEPGLQFYGGNFMSRANLLKSGTRDDYRTGFCLETQHFPDSPNQPTFPTTVLEKGKTYTSSTIHKFSISK